MLDINKLSSFFINSTQKLSKLMEKVEIRNRMKTPGIVCDKHFKFN